MGWSVNDQGLVALECQQGTVHWFHGAKLVAPSLESDEEQVNLAMRIVCHILIDYVSDEGLPEACQSLASFMNIINLQGVYSGICRKFVRLRLKWVSGLFVRRFRLRENNALPGQVVKYAAVPAGERLHQGEIIVGLIQVKQSVATIGEHELARIDEFFHPFAIVMTQDCDLEQDFRLRGQANEKLSLLVSILFCEAATASELKGKIPQGKDIWKRVIQNKDERYQCFESIPSGQDSLAQGLPCLGCDFKRYFTVPAEEVYRRIDLKQITRRCRLITPYAEHLLNRFCSFQSRIPLPENHDVPP